MLTEKQLARAIEWYDKHTEFVDRIVEAETDIAFPPSKEDASNPALWKAGSWKWFLEKEQFNAG